ncbi:MAG: xylulokinase [Succinivibrionaceae bacterium]|nr:xylulokinase [Succinivibrionaceae bacterium]
MAYLLGVDLGTSGTKTVLFDQQGKAVASAHASYDLRQERNGYAEQDPEDWYRATVSTIREVLSSGAAGAGEIRALAISGQMHGLVMLDAQGEVIRPAILWCDARTGEECQEIERLVGRERLIEICANPALPGFTAPKILWVRRHEPQAFARCRTILLPKDYVRYRLTGRLCQEISDASGTNLLDIGTLSWSTEILGKLGLDPALFPELVQSPERVGTITAGAAAATGLDTATVVAGGGGDNACAALGTGVCADGDAFLTLGTSGVIFAHTARKSVDPLGRVHTFCSAVPGQLCAMSCTLAAGLSLEWYKDTILGGEGDFGGILAAAASVPIGADGLVYLPYLMGERSPILDPDARGVLFGLSARHTRAHLARATIEGVTLSQRQNLHVLGEMGIHPGHLTLCGGGARSPEWRQVVADALRVSVGTIEAREGPALGAAILASVACGMHPDVQSACRAMAGTGKPTEFPREEQGRRYDEVYGLYASLYPTLRPAFGRLAALRERLEGGERQFPSVLSRQFERYGKVVSGIDTERAGALLARVPCPSDRVAYSPSEPLLEGDRQLAEEAGRVFGGMPVQVGFCGGCNHDLNCLEYHRNSELNIMGTDTLLMLAPLTAVVDGHLDTEQVEIFSAPRGAAVLFYETTLHYAPVCAPGAAQFRVCCVLPRGTNTDLPGGEVKTGEGRLLVMRNKWVLAHPESPEARAQLTAGTLLGDNLHA